MDKQSFAEFMEEVETNLSFLAPGLLARPLLEWAAAFRDQTIEVGDVTAYELAHDGIVRLEPEGDGSAGDKKVLKTDGFNAWRQAALFAMAPEAVVENRLTGRRDLDDCARIRCIVNDTIREKRGEPSNWVEEAISRRQTSTSGSSER